MMRSCLGKSVVIAFCTLGAVHGAGVAGAQGLEIEPIILDIAPGNDEGLILAALPSDGDAPRVSTEGGSRAAALVRAGLPQPSIILGTIDAGQEEVFGISSLLPATVASLAFPLGDLDARNALRARDAGLFRQLVEEGHVDPPDGELNRTLQIELQRMNCYRSGIDGAWGPGSRRSVTEYFAELPGVSWPDQAASIGLFRAILINGDVRCETPVAAAPARTTAPARAAAPARQSAPARQQAPARQAAPAPRQQAPAPAQPRLSIGGSGVFR